jgi:hypothetical protein
MGMRIDPNARFERQKQLAQQESNAEKQVAKDALARRFAAMGRTNSGAAVTNERLVEREAGDALSRRMQGIQDAQDTEGLRRQEIEEGRKYQTSEREASQLFSRGEREGSQGFMADQAKLGREFATSERLGSQQFASGEAQKGRAWQSEENYQNRNEQRKMFDIQHNLAALQYEEAIRQFGKTFDEDQRVTNFNMDMARSEANKKDIFQNLGGWFTDFYKGDTGSRLGQIKNFDLKFNPLRQGYERINGR